MEAVDPLFIKLGKRKIQFVISDPRSCRFVDPIRTLGLKFVWINSRKDGQQCPGKLESTHNLERSSGREEK